ncbi:uncharacterized protein LOC119304912 [Triticum dicoccoides]|uniref:uncharacterized protein LOC119304912 n=1 Tax=Triticum dicoccoides TaxID=85692 RepID=UPI0018904EA1|nr:uncharacterized protein LOC119304912 [Triticum dicoccoides]
MQTVFGWIILFLFHIDTCTLHAALATMESLKKFQYAEFQPPKDFEWILSAIKLTAEYKTITEKNIGEEADMAQRGWRRLEAGLYTLQEIGAEGHNTLQPKKDPIRFKLKSYSRIDINENEGEGLKVAVRDVRAGTVFLIYFRISRNYFTLKPGEIYHYDATKAYVSPSFSIPASHVVMMIGSGDTAICTELPNGGTQCENSVHLNFQNSAGKLFGDDGFGKVGSSSVKGLYKITV